MDLSSFTSTIPPRQAHVVTPCHATRHASFATPTLRKQFLQKCQAVDLAAAVVLGFLPWSGCSQGGFYSTGIEGSHGQGCQSIYQPAAAAEARFAADQQQRMPPIPPQAADNGPQPQMAASSSLTYTRSSSNTQSDADSSVRNSGVAVSSQSSSSSSANLDSPSSSSTSQESLTEQQQLQQGPAVDDMQEVPDAVKDLVREILREDNRARTKQLVDDAWQTLE